MIFLFWEKNKRNRFVFYKNKIKIKTIRKKNIYTAEKNRNNLPWKNRNNLSKNCGFDWFLKINEIRKYNVKTLLILLIEEKHIFM